MSRRVIKIDTKHNLTKVVEWLERNVGPKEEHWKLKTQNETTRGRRLSLYGIFCEFDDTVDESIILYFALRWV
jgi:hypothetical protein